MDLRLRTVEDERAERDAAATTAADFAPAKNAEAFKTITTAEPTTVPGDVKMAPGTTAVAAAAAAGNSAGSSFSFSEMDVDFDMFAKSRASPLRAVDTSKSGPQCLPEKPKTYSPGLPETFKAQSFTDGTVATGISNVLVYASNSCTAAPGNSAGKSLSCSDLEVDFDLFARSRASPIRALEKSETRPQSVPMQFKARHFTPKPSFQPRSLFLTDPPESPSLHFPEPSETRSLPFPELSRTRSWYFPQPSETRSLYFPEPSRTRSWYFPQPSETHSLYFPDPSETRSLYFPEPLQSLPSSLPQNSGTRPLSLVESSKTSFLGFEDNFVNPSGRSSSESEVDFELFVQNRASPHRIPGTPENRSQSLPEKYETRSLSSADSSQTTLGVPKPSYTSPVSSTESSQTALAASKQSPTRPLSLADSSKTRSDRASETSPRTVQGVPFRIHSPKASKSPPPVPRRAVVENYLKEVQHLKQEPKKKGLLLAQKPVPLPRRLPGSDTPKKANKGKYLPL